MIKVTFTGRYSKNVLGDQLVRGIIVQPGLVLIEPNPEAVSLKRVGRPELFVPEIRRCSLKSSVLAKKKTSLRDRSIAGEFKIQPLVVLSNPEMGDVENLFPVFRLAKLDSSLFYTCQPIKP